MFFKKKKSLLIVCRANITRSAYLHGYMEKWLHEQYSFSRKKLRVESAGVEAKRGSKAHEVVDHVAKLNGFSLKAHRTSSFTRFLKDFFLFRFCSPFQLRALCKFRRTVFSVFVSLCFFRFYFIPNEML